MTKIISLYGPTAVGKTTCAIEIAQQLGCEIVSADSRQFYKEMTIGTAVPSNEELMKVKHNLVHSHSIMDEPVTSGVFEREALEIINNAKSDYIVVVGGSGLYIKALLYGLDSLPKDDELRETLKEKTLEELLEVIKANDPLYIEMVDTQNRRRVERAVEVIMLTGKPYSAQRTGGNAHRNLNFVEVVLDRPRDVLYDRINQRVDIMMAEGLENEARQLYDYRERQALHTVGYREMFDYFDGLTSLDEAVELIKRNSRRYAKRQLTWARALDGAVWMNPDNTNQIIEYVTKSL